MTFTALIARLTELEGKASAGPWEAKFSATSRAGDLYFISLDETVSLGASDLSKADAQLIAEMRNHLPTLLEALTLQREALEFYADRKHFQTIFDNETGTRAEIYEKYQKHSIGDLGVKAMEAIARVDALAGKGEKT